jgi:peptide/nickel transport system permease protein
MRPSQRARLNLPLLIGSLILLAIAALAIWGNQWAPVDPMQRNPILRIEGRWLTPPYPPLTPGFPLGSDQFGRDLLSQLMWAVRPTLIMILIVAFFRLVLGTLLGLVCGWSDGLIVRGLGQLSKLALAIPTLIVALVVIAQVGIQRGIWAFIIGLALTGWAETAQAIRIQTRLIKEQVFIETSRALGASSWQILSRHVLPHVRPLILILMAFEVSAVTLLTGGLGFLGHYIGGGVFIQIDDFVTRRATGHPELGQMLATTLDITTQPFTMLAAGSMIFIIVLGAYLFGQGLRLRLERRIWRRSALGEVWEALSSWVETSITYPASQRLGGFPVLRPLPAVTLLLVAILFSLTLADIEQLTLIGQLTPAPGDNRMASDGPVQAQATQAFSTPRTTEIKEAGEAPTASPGTQGLVRWSFEVPGGAKFEPFPATDGSVYLISHDDILYSIDPQGEILWQGSLPSPLFQSDRSFDQRGQGLINPPRVTDRGDFLVVSFHAIYLLDPRGNIIWWVDTEKPLFSPLPIQNCCPWHAGRMFLLDTAGNLYAFDPGTGLDWQFAPETQDPFTKSYPVIREDGTLFYTRGRGSDIILQAVDAEGHGLWSVSIPQTTLRATNDLPFPVRGKDFVIVNATFVDVQSSRILEVTFPEEPASYQVDGGGQLYMQNVEFMAVLETGPHGLTFIPTDQMEQTVHWMATVDGWIFEGYINWQYEDFTVIEQRRGRITMCKGQRDPEQLTCRAVASLGEPPVWEVTVEGIRSVKFGASIPELNRLLIVSGQNILYAIDIVE